MAKLPHQSTVPPVDDTDVATKAFAESSGGGGGPAAQGDYLVVNLNSDQIPLVVGDYAEFDVDSSVFEQRGTGINPNGNPGEIVLKAGRTYIGRFTFYTPFAAGGQSVRMQWVDAATDIALPGASSAQARDTGSGGDISSSDSVVFIHAPLVDTVVACRVFAIEETPGLGGASVIDIFEIGGSPPFIGKGDYLQVGLASTMTSVSLPQRVLFDTVDTSRGVLVLDTVTNVGRVSGLKAGRTYLMQATLSITGSGNFTRFQWYNVTAAALLSGAAIALSVNSGGVISSTSMCFHVFTPSVDTEVEVRITVVDDVNDDINQGDSFALVVEVGTVPAVRVATALETTGVDVDVAAAAPPLTGQTLRATSPTTAAWQDSGILGGGLEFMDSIEVTSDQTTVTFGAGGDGRFGRALDGDVDKDYFLVSTLKNSNAPSISLYIFRPNGLETNVATESTQTSGGGVQAFAVSRLELMNTTFDDIYATTYISAVSGRTRMFDTHCLGSNPGAVDVFRKDQAGVWDEDSTNITSLDIHCSTGAFIGAGSTFVLYRLTRQNVRADSADTYERHVESAVDVGSATTEQTTGHTHLVGRPSGLLRASRKRLLRVPSRST